MPIQLLHGPVVHYIQLGYTGFVNRYDAYDEMLGLHHKAGLLVPQLCFMQPPTAAHDNDFLDFFGRRHMFSSTFSFCNHNDDDRALHDLSADSTVTSLLPCDTAYLSVS